MPAIAALSLSDGTASRSYVPQSIEGNLATYTYQPAGTTSLDARWKITHSVSLPKAGSVVVRTKSKLVIPVMDTVDTSKKVADIMATVDFVLPTRSLKADRTALWTTLSNLIVNAITTSAVEDFNNVY